MNFTQQIKDPHMRILVYVGYQKQKLSPELFKSTGLGGTEIACIKLAEGLKMYGHQVFISGDVVEAEHNGVTWLPTERLHQQESNQFDIIISASYIHFILEFKDYTRAKKIFWAHNTDWHSWYKGIQLKNSIELFDQVDQIICLTDWHANDWYNKFGYKNISVIGNGIDKSSFIGNPTKIKNRFIWSSAPERGLRELLQNWDRILQIKPNATLEVFCPSYALESLDYLQKETKLLEQTGIIVRGNQNQEELHRSMLLAEYWPYLTSYEETYCITALEMQYAGCLPITTDVAALAETVCSGIILDNEETKWDLAIQILNNLGTELKDKAVQSCMDWARQQSWEFRILEWQRTITDGFTK